METLELMKYTNNLCFSNVVILGNEETVMCETVYVGGSVHVVCVIV